MGLLPDSSKVETKKLKRLYLDTLESAVVQKWLEETFLTYINLQSADRVLWIFFSLVVHNIGPWLACV